MTERIAYNMLAIITQIGDVYPRIIATSRIIKAAYCNILMKMCKHIAILLIICLPVSVG